MKILFLSRWFPYPADNGSKIRIFNLLRQLSTRHSIDLISFDTPEVQGPPPEELLAVCHSVQRVAYRPFVPGRAQALLGFFAARPRALIDTFNQAFAGQVAAAVASERYDAVVASQIDMLPYAENLAIPLRIFEEAELTMLYEQFAAARNPLRRLRAALTWAKLTAYLSRVLPGFQGITVASLREHDLVKSILPHPNVAIIPNGVDLEYLSGDFGPLEPDSLVYNGAMTYQANFDAVQYFLGEVLPLIQNKCPDVRLYVTGSTSGVPVEALPANPGVVFTGYLRDVRPRVARTAVSVVPLRVGGGTRLKVLESMALGTPVVATSKGAEGLDVLPGRDILIADTAVGFASAVLRLLTNPALRAEIAAAGQQCAAEKYNWDSIGERYFAFLEQAAGAADTDA